MNNRTTSSGRTVEAPQHTDQSNPAPVRASHRLFFVSVPCPFYNSPLTGLVHPTSRTSFLSDSSFSSFCLRRNLYQARAYSTNPPKFACAHEIRTMDRAHLDSARHFAPDVVI
ncbi:hypothetical protein EVAR_87358_1 [Eumeta japonica]|uniref:Uncharacterized protein n=1 Tax=Eumeta variegata TaxID=151549 RepID=A0A4C1YWB6_EUMVA|nr:hypothetical protein EVAR_87358_1 [Eumeta japonica]